jgi:hypothetical protein
MSEMEAKVSPGSAKVGCGGMQSQLVILIMIS